MHISISIRRIHRHIDILRAEKREAEILVEYLHKLETEYSGESVYDFDVLDSHLSTAEKIVENITRRISLMEFIEETFSKLIDSTERILLDAKESVKAPD